MSSREPGDSIPGEPIEGQGEKPGYVLHGELRVSSMMARASTCPTSGSCRTTTKRGHREPERRYLSLIPNIPRRMAQSNDGKGKPHRTDQRHGREHLIMPDVLSNDILLLVPRGSPRRERWSLPTSPAHFVRNPGNLGMRASAVPCFCCVHS